MPTAQFRSSRHVSKAWEGTTAQAKLQQSNRNDLRAVKEGFGRIANEAAQQSKLLALSASYCMAIHAEVMTNCSDCKDAFLQTKNNDPSIHPSVHPSVRPSFRLTV
jgi:hypothetical protein